MPQARSVNDLDHAGQGGTAVSDHALLSQLSSHKEDIPVVGSKVDVYPRLVSLHGGPVPVVDDVGDGGPGARVEERNQDLLACTVAVHILDGVGGDLHSCEGGDQVQGDDQQVLTSPLVRDLAPRDDDYAAKYGISIDTSFILKIILFHHKFYYSGTYSLYFRRVRSRLRLSTWPSLRACCTTAFLVSLTSAWFWRMHLL